jgi:MraZ protein
MFRGRYQHAIDPKGRVSIPARYRDLLAQFDSSTVVLVPNPDALEVHPLSEWEQLETRINERSMFDARLRTVGRLYISRATEASLDGTGRILIPPETRQYAGLTRDVTFVGLGRRFFEIWDRGRFEEWERVHGDGLPVGFDRLAEMGV